MRRREIVYDKGTLEYAWKLYHGASPMINDIRERLAALQQCTFVAYADGSLIGVRGPNLEAIDAAARALIEAPADIAALLNDITSFLTDENAALRAEIAHRAQIDAEDMQRIQGWAGSLYKENQMLRAHLEAIRDYCDNPAAVSAEGMTDAEKVGGMWSQAVAALAALEARP